MEDRKFTEEELDNFERYERVRTEGRYNMVMEAGNAMLDCHLTFLEYLFIQENYDDMKEEYENSRLY